MAAPHFRQNASPAAAGVPHDIQNVAAVGAGAGAAAGSTTATLTPARFPEGP